MGKPGKGPIKTYEHRKTAFFVCLTALGLVGLICLVLHFIAPDSEWFIKILLLFSALMVATIITGDGFSKAQKAIKGRKGGYEPMIGSYSDWTREWEEDRPERQAAEPSFDPAAKSGSCGDRCSWSFEDGTLTVSGTGRMEGWAKKYRNDSCPWKGRIPEIRRIVIEDGIKEIGERSFSGDMGIYKSLESVSMANSVTALFPYSFRGCRTLLEICLPKGLKTIGTGAFQDCSGLTRIVIPDSVSVVCTDSFENCTSLREAVLSCRMNKIGRDTFAGCTALTSITIPDSITEIEDNAFRGCDALRDIRFLGTRELWDRIGIGPKSGIPQNVNVLFLG